MRASRLTVIALAAMFGMALAVPPVFAAGDPTPSTDQGSQKDKKKKKSEQEFIKGYQEARALALEGKYQDAIAAFHALKHDDNAEVANYIGYSFRKLGDYGDAKVWYEKALAADPNHTRTWQYYGLWQLEQGNRLKAEDYLQKIQLICGNTTCEDYLSLKQAIDSGKISY